ncbi:hypothetical protein INR77_05310 [Erythrobacter sp. SCSIO 43205]|uniref:hypothetical protein n=1 Tax=Erythrobacter sp. SCSIO 43205 TaxID=2779361 RepID=UPI001CA8A7F6|nr:hypothetical protein [Erythrobacter sp. SCSIO 43205]UAB79109.1 hypothetical protein INR77_05310 [Erythrobacter sp. SCSIO 43205]
MRLAVLTAVTACAFAIAPSSAQAGKEPYVIPAGSKWNVDYGAAKCRLSRTFGSGPNTHVLLLDQSGAGSTAALTVAGPSFERFRLKKDTSIDLGGSTTIEAEPRRAQLGTMRYGIVFSGLDFGGEDEDSEASKLDVTIGNSIDHLTFTQGRRAVRLETGPLGEAFDVLNDCTRRLARG